MEKAVMGLWSHVEPSGLRQLHVSRLMRGRASASVFALLLRRSKSRMRDGRRRLPKHGVKVKFKGPKAACA